MVFLRVREKKIVCLCIKNKLLKYIYDQIKNSVTSVLFTAVSHNRWI